MAEYVELTTGKHVEASEKAYHQIYADAGFVTPDEYQQHLDDKALAEANAKATADALVESGKKKAAGEDGS